MIKEQIPVGTKFNLTIHSHIEILDKRGVYQLEGKDVSDFDTYLQQNEGFLFALRSVIDGYVMYQSRKYNLGILKSSDVKIKNGSIITALEYVLITGSFLSVVDFLFFHRKFRHEYENEIAQKIANFLSSRRSSINVSTSILFEKIEETQTEDKKELSTNYKEYLPVARVMVMMGFLFILVSGFFYIQYKLKIDQAQASEERLICKKIHNDLSEIKKFQQWIERHHSRPIACNH